MVVLASPTTLPRWQQECHAHFTILVSVLIKIENRGYNLSIEERAGLF
jgi:hypothetical protein